MQFYNVHGELLIRMEDNVLYLKTMLGYFPIVVFFCFLKCSNTMGPVLE